MFDTLLAYSLYVTTTGCLKKNASLVLFVLNIRVKNSYLLHCYYMFPSNVTIYGFLILSNICHFSLTAASAPRVWAVTCGLHFNAMNEPTGKSSR